MCMLFVVLHIEDTFRPAKATSDIMLGLVGITIIDGR